MLKGIKKIVTHEEQELEPNQARPPVNQTQLKNAAIMEEEEQDQPVIREVVHVEDRKQKMGVYQECYDLFLQGNEQLLSEKLALINQERRESRAKQQKQQTGKESGKFQYNLNFDEGKDATNKAELKKRNQPIMASNRVSQYCIFCPDNEELQLLSASNYVYLAMPKYKTFRSHYHLILAPVDHEQTMIGLNSDTLTEINNYKKCLIQAFDKAGLQVIFFEQYSKSNSHIYIECLAMSYNKAQDLPFFFKQSLEDVEGNWATHKSIIKIEKQKGGIQRQIPKPIKYFYIDFSVGYGYAHVIENQRFWKRQFCYQVLATALGMETHVVKTSEEYSPEQLTQKRQNFNKIWVDYDWTQLI